MWLFAMFDLPVKTQADKRQYVHFRKFLLQEGFCQLQYSVYARYFPSEDASDTFHRHVEGALPPKGQVRLVSVTDRQFEKMRVYFGKRRESAEETPAQLMLF